MKYPTNIDTYIGPYNLQGWYRVFKEEHRKTPLGTGFGLSRFSSFTHSFTVLYAGKTVRAAACEGLIRDRFEKNEHRLITADEIKKYVIAPISTLQPVNLIDFRDNQTFFHLGLPHDIIGASDHRFGQKFSALAYSDHRVDGILYPSRFLGDLCCVLYDRALAKLVMPKRKEVTALLREPSLVSDLKKLDIQIVE